MDKGRIAFYTGDASSCLKVLQRLQEAGEPIWESTKRWLQRRECLYKYVIFDADQWCGYNSLEILEFRTDDEYFNKRLEEIVLK